MQTTNDEENMMDLYENDWQSITIYHVQQL